MLANVSYQANAMAPPLLCHQFGVESVLHIPLCKHAFFNAFKILCLSV